MRVELKDPRGMFQCRHIRAKEMFYQAEVEGEDPFRNSIYWCLRTQEHRGPDGKTVTRQECVPGRTCFER